ncbi:MAG TPA: exodeoxyribonuclease V subunit beta [Spirochaetota bacterium]|nr:exodeoxyribonuclease V subunit beta [Spirochaetota bacterium]
MEKFNAAVTPLEGTNLIEASAGTGKTFTISMIYLRLIVEMGLRIDQVLVVTFTLPATMELRLRIRNVISEALRFCETGIIEEKIVADIMAPFKTDPGVVQRLRSALKSFDEASVYTIHSFCQQVLADNAFESGALFSSDIATDDEAELKLASDFWRKNIYSLPGEVVRYILKKTSPAKLLELYRKRPLSPRLKILPQSEEIASGDIEYLALPVRQRYESFCKAWSSERGSVIRIFTETESLKGNIYRKDYIEGRINALDEYVKDGDCFAAPPQLVYFTSGKLSESSKKGEPPSSPLFDDAQSLYDAVSEYNSSFGAFLNMLIHRFFLYMESESRMEKDRTGLRGFDDLIKDVETALKKDDAGFLAESVGNRYRAALIDEFQDTDDLQFEIFSRIFMRDKSILFLIGDPKQAIYRFRGADIFSYIKAAGMVQNRYTLASNFRSTPELISSVNALFSSSSSPFLFEDIGFSPVSAGKPDQCNYIYHSGNKTAAMNIGLADYSIAKSSDDDNDSIILRQLSFEISELTGSGSYKFMPEGRDVAASDIAVLVRSHAQASAVQGALAGYGIPSVARGHESVLSTPEAGEFCRLISAIAEPGRSRLVKSAAATSIIGYDALTLYRMNEDSGDGAALLGEFTEKLHSYRNIWLRNGFMDMLTLLLHNEGITVNMLGRDRGERAVANINHLSEILNMVQFENGFSPDELAAWFEKSVIDPPFKDEYAVRLDKDSDAVNIVTMHACKGLEYPVVFCPYLTHSWQPPGDTMVYHDPDEDNRPVLYIDKETVPDTVKEQKKKEDLAENIRLMYVALTRAKSYCRILFMMKKGFKSSAPFYLLLKEHVKGDPKVEACYDPFIRILSGLETASEGNIKFSVISGDTGKKYKSPEGKGEDLKHRTFDGEIIKSWGMQSYSSITKTMHDEKSDGFAGKTADTGSGIFAFPRGTKAGLCLHEIFEITDFRDTDRDTVSGTVLSLLRKYGYDESWMDDVTDMFFNVTGAQLPGNQGVRLSDIDMKSRLSEMEFNFPLGEFSVSGLRDIFSRSPLYGKEIYDRMGQDESVIQGMMKGFIDLVFRAGEKYFIADWKSNSLGAGGEDYTLPRMEEEMLRHNYHLQYYIYSVALHRYLSLRLGREYSFSRNFGGVYYFFIRGMREGDNSPGIFHTIPDGDTVMKLDRFFTGEGAE